MGEIAAVVAVLACTLFTGAALYINVVEHPARLSCGTKIAATQWAPSYKRATVMQVPLAVLATLGGVARWLQTSDALWLLGSLCIVSVIPFTVVAILPTNKRLLEPDLDRGSEETRTLLEAWGRLHGVRSAMSLMASLFFVWALGKP